MCGSDKCWVSEGKFLEIDNFFCIIQGLTVLSDENFKFQGRSGPVLHNLEYENVKNLFIYYHCLFMKKLQFCIIHRARKWRSKFVREKITFSIVCGQKNDNLREEIVFS